MGEKACKGISLIMLAIERVSIKKKLEEKKQKQQLDSLPYLPKDCVANILIWLPIESLQRSRFVCKQWYRIIKSPSFIRDNLHHAEKIMIFLSPVKRLSRGRFDQDSGFQENPNTFSVEKKIFELKSVPMLFRPLIKPTSKSAIKYFVLEDGKSMIRNYSATCIGRIRASCDGLIVVDNKLEQGQLVIMNPVTRELKLLPLATICPPHHESFALVCCGARGYKLVHLFRDKSQFIGCEILEIGEKSWRDISGPSFGLMKWFGYDPVFALGALHWVPELDRSEYVVTMTIDDEKFHMITLPKTSRFNDRIMEACERLCFVTHEEMNEISIWVLGSVKGEAWTKTYTIAVGCIRDLVPLYFSRSKLELYFLDKDGSVFCFDFGDGHMKKVTTTKGYFKLAERKYTLHVNSLVSWEIKENDRDCDIISP